MTSPNKKRASSKSAASLQPKQAKTSGRDENSGRFLPGNRFWEARSSAGPNPKFANGDDLWQACSEYFEWTEKNPLWEDKLVTFQGAAIHEPVAKMRAMTVGGLCIFLDIDTTTWHEWKKSRPDLSPVISRTERVIYAQKFGGAAADLLNANIIARDLGLADKAELTGKDGSELIPEGSSTREIARAILDVLRQAKTEDAE